MKRRGGRGGAGAEAEAEAEAGTSARGPQNEAERRALQARAERWRRNPLPLSETAIDGMLVLQPKTLQQLSQMGRGSYQNLAHKSSQTREDDEEREVQTERPADARAAEAQAPEDLGASRESLEARGRPRGRRAGARPPGGRGGRPWGGGELDIAGLQRLGRFVASAGAVVERLLAERQRGSKSLEAAFASGGAPPEAAAGGGAAPLSAGEIRLQPPSDLAEGRRITAMGFYPTAETGAKGQLACPRLLVAYAPTTTGVRAARERVAGRGSCGAGVLLVWDLARPQAPDRVLTCEGSPASCCWGGGDTVVAGLADGGLCIWDLADPAFASVSLGQAREAAMGGGGGGGGLLRGSPS